MDLVGYATFVIASVVIVVVPGPTVTLIIANSLRHGTAAGLLNIAGTQFGIATMLAVVALGLQFLVETMAGVFDIVRFAGAIYLVWLGVKLLRGGRLSADATEPLPRSRRSFFWQGFLVLWSNPKILLMFGALMPHFIVAEGNAIVQTLILGITFMVVATVFDSVYAIAAGGARRWLTRTRIRAVETVSGMLLIAGGIWLALARR